MQEKLKIFSANGETLLERDLTEAAKPLMLLAGESPQLVETVPQGADVLGALVRDEDGWTLASAKDDQPVSSGPKTGTDFHLTAGVACALGPWVFRIEREGAGTGTVLLWRVGSSAVAADPLVQGRNQVAAAKDGAYAVNPAVAGAELCSIFPTAEGVDVTASDGGAQRLSVPFATLFAVGRFQGMALPASDAAAAVKSGRPFGWPARRTRAGLMAMLLLVGLVALAALSFTKKKASVDELIGAKRGPEQVARKLAADENNTDEDALVYQSSFFRSLPFILQAARSPITRDLIKRGQQISGHVGGTNAKEYEREIQDIMKFLKAVDDIQDAAQKGNWASLKKTLAAADRKMFTRCDADKFYSDAQELADFITVELPKFFVSASAIGASGSADAEKRIRARFRALLNNLFMSGKIAHRERDSAEQRWQAISAYVQARARFLSSSAAAGADLRNAWADFVDAFDSEEDVFAPMLKRERELLMQAIVKRAETASSVSLIHLCALGEAVGVDNARLAQWQARATAARKELARQYREKYSDYRMRAAVAPAAPETLAVLDEMIALGLEDNSFHQWALREKARVQGRKAGVPEKIPEETEGRPEEPEKKGEAK